METSTIALIIVACTCILYVSERFSVATVTLLGLLAMVYLDVITVSEAFSGFASTPVMLVIGMVIIIDALLKCGVAGKLGSLLSGLIGKGEKLFVIVVFVSAAAVSLFVTNAALVAMFMPFIASVATASGGTITKKNTYLPLAAGALIGGTGSLAGSTSPLLANGVLESAGAETMRFFEPLPISLSIIIVIVICYWLFFYKFQAKCFDFEEIVGDSAKELANVKIDKPKAIISVSVFLICSVLFVIQPFGWDLGQIAITGALVLVMTKCVDGKESLRNMFWPALITLGATLGIAKGFINSGIGEIIINWLMSVLGEGVANPIVLVTVFLLSAYVLSLFMSDGSLVAMLSSIAVPMAMEIGCNPMPLAMACVFGASLAMATPAATTSVTMVQVAGYRFKDYVRVGGAIGIIGLITAWTAIILIYGLI